MSVRPLGSDLQTKAEDELNEIPNRMQEDLKHIQDWIETQPHLSIRTDDQWLIGFLRGCKFSLHQTQAKLDYFYTMRTLETELFSNRDPLSPEIQEIIKSGFYLLLPATENPAGPRIIFMRWSVCDVNKMSLINLIKAYFMIVDVLINEDDNAMIAGVQILQDYKGFPLSYVLQFTPSAVKKLILCLQSAYPVRVKGIYFINAPTAIESIIKLLKSFMNQKLRDRMHIYSENNSNELHKIIPKKLMPKEYGGNNGHLDELTATLKKKVESYRNWFMEDAKYCTNESLRPGEPKISTDIFGVEGTFRKLAVD